MDKVRKELQGLKEVTEAAKQDLLPQHTESRNIPYKDGVCTEKNLTLKI